MKKLWFFFVVIYSFVLVSVLTAQNVSPQFSELKGMEDAQGNTHLLYRIYSHQQELNFNYGTNDINNLVPGTSIDTIIFQDNYYCGVIFGSEVRISSYDFWHNDITKHIVCGYKSDCWEYSGYISRFDSSDVRTGLFEFYDKISISKQTDSLVYCSPPILKSTNGGLTWNNVNDSLSFLSLYPFNDQVYFAVGLFYGWGGSYLYKTTNGGNSFYPVDTLLGMNTYHNFNYDVNGNNIYRDGWLSSPTYSIKRSSNQGNAFTWENIYSAQHILYLCLDELQSGAIYLADGKKIMYSSDYGNTFSLYKELDKKIIGIYKKPNSEILYAASKYQIYEISPDTTTIIKSLPIPEELLSFYPLSVGNYWIYKVTDWSYPYYSEDTFTKRVLSKETLSNNKEYFKIEEKYHSSSYTNYVYERVDSVNGHVYRFDNQCSNPDSEKVIDDFTSELGDSLLIQRFTVCWDSIFTLVSAEGSENIFNENRNYKSFEYNWLMGFTHKLVSGIGIYSIRSGYDFGETNYTLNGCVINDIVYGDTTLTDVGDENNSTPTVYRLEQNYPNPFNPTTKIRWQSPSAGYQTIKVYDVLGNEVITLVDEYRNSGIYNIDFDASKFSSGVYFYQLKAGDFISTKKMVILK